MRLIDADALIQKRNHAKTYAPDMYVIGQGYVMDATTIDAVPMVHGKWVHGKKEKLYYTCEMEGYWEIPIYCSECKYDLEKYGGEESNYCPNCGAKMKGAEHE